MSLNMVHQRGKQTAVQPANRLPNFGLAVVLYVIDGFVAMKYNTTMTCACRSVRVKSPNLCW